MARIVAYVLLGLAAAASAGENRLFLAAQSEFAANRGFSLAIENRGPDGSVLPVGTARAVFGIADGTGWKWIDVPLGATIGRTAALRAVYENGRAELFVDGVSRGSVASVFVPSGALLTARDYPGWASAPADYRPVQGRTVLTGTTPVEFPAAPVSGPLAAWESTLPSTFRFVPGNRFSVETSVRFDAPVDLRANAPWGDRWGQAVHATHPGKVTSDAELARDWAKEDAWLAKTGRDKGLDPYGGVRDAWKTTGTGFYRTLKRDGKWWLVTPLGHPVFYTGICTAPSSNWERTPTTGREFLWAELPPKTGATAKLWTGDPWGTGAGGEWVAFNAWNLVRRFGAEYERKSSELLVKRVRAWGLTGLGKWSDGTPGVPDLPVLQLGNTPKLVHKFDPWDPAHLTALENDFRLQTSSRRNDPFLLGWSVGNEIDMIVLTEEARAILAKGDSPARRAMLAAVGNPANPTDAQIETMRRLYAEEFYRRIYQTIKRVDPDHLYFGSWIVPGWWQNDSDWDMHARHCDVIGFDRYADDYAGIAEWSGRLDKPMLLGEFGHPPHFRGARGWGRYAFGATENDDRYGEKLAESIRKAAVDPKCVGAFVFQYRDQTLTGRGPGLGTGLTQGERYAFGLVDAQDRPKWTVLNRARPAFRNATTWRLGRR